MKKTLRGTAGAALVSVSLLAAALPVGASFKIDTIMKNDLNIKALPSSSLNMGGSSFDAPLVQAAETQWNTATGKAPFSSYNTTKSGTGRANAISGSYNIGFSDFPLNIAGPDVGPGSSDTSETTANYVQVPVALGGVAIIFHFGTGISGTTGALLKKYPLTVNGLTLGKIFNGKITNWDDPAIAKTNPHLVVKGKDLLPNLPIAVLSRTSGSGTTFMFQDYLNRVDAADFPTASSAAFTHAAATFANSGLLDAGVHSTLGAIGYVEYGYALANNSLTMNLINKSGKNVALTGAGVLAAATAGLLNIKAHGGFNTTSINNFSINNSTGATVYPIAGFSYAIVKKVQSDKNTAIAVVKFLDYLSHQGGGTATSNTFGQDLADANGYVALPLTLQTIARTLISGVTFGGTHVLSATN
jgi:phosphate transport system substrate-binding protein